MPDFFSHPKCQRHIERVCTHHTCDPFLCETFLWKIFLLLLLNTQKVTLAVHTKSHVCLYVNNSLKCSDPNKDWSCLIILGNFLHIKINENLKTGFQVAWCIWKYRWPEQIYMLYAGLKILQEAHEWTINCTCLSLGVVTYKS